MYNSGCPTVTNCTFSRNWADDSSGGRRRTAGRTSRWRGRTGGAVSEAYLQCSSPLG